MHIYNIYTGEWMQIIMDDYWPTNDSKFPGRSMKDEGFYYYDHTGKPSMGLRKKYGG